MIKSNVRTATKCTNLKETWVFMSRHVSQIQIEIPKSIFVSSVPKCTLKKVHLTPMLRNFIDINRLSLTVPTNLDSSVARLHPDLRTFSGTLQNTLFYDTAFPIF